MRQILWIAAIAVVVMLLMSRSRHRPHEGGPYPDVPKDEWFQTHVVAPSQSSLVLAKFGAEWCGPCRAMDPQLDRIEKTLGDRLDVVRIDTGEQPQLAEHFGIAAIPLTYLVDNGRIVDDRAGYLSAEEIQDWVTPWLK